MPDSPSDPFRVRCPHCGHSQPEPRQVISTVCRKCGRHLSVRDLAQPSLRPPPSARMSELRRVTCFDCGTEMEVAVSAQSSMCKRCSSYLDFQDYTVQQAVSKSFRTKGRLRVEKSGYIFNTEILASEVTVHGRIQGKVTAERSIIVHTGAELRGSVRTPLLVIPEGECFFWREGMQAEVVEVGGELVGEPRLLQSLRLLATGRLFGGVQTRNLVVEAGAILVGRLEVSA